MSKTVIITRTAWDQLQAEATEYEKAVQAMSLRPPVFLPDGRVQIVLLDYIHDALVRIDPDPSKAIDLLVRRQVRMNQ